MTKRKETVSVIMPVYNSVEYLAQAIDSVLAQTFEDFELILINDGSTDNSLQICEKYQKVDDRIKIINKENGGLCSARNVGLDNAKGKYIAFIDNDDKFEPSYLEVAVSALEDCGADIFRCNRKRIQIFDDGSEKTDVSGVPKYSGFLNVVQSEEFFSDYYNIKSSGAMYGIWNGIYSAELFDGIRFDTRIRFGGEDWLVNLQLYNKAQSVVFSDKALYVYFRRVTHSTSAKFDFNRIDSLKWIFEYEDALLQEKLGEKGINTRRAVAAIYLVHTVKILQHSSCSLSRKEKCAYLKRLRDDRVFIGELKARMLRSPVKENICLWLYAHGKIKMMYKIIATILGRRGNT